MPSYRLHYFDIRGRGELARILFRAADKKFDDVRHTKETWPALKEKTPFGQLPCLEIDGKMYGQSWAIYQYLAREFGFYGKNNIEALRIDGVAGLIIDFTSLMVKALFLEQDETKKKELLEKLLKEDAIKFFTSLEKILKDNGSNGYFVGNAVTLADFAVFDVAENVMDKKVDILAQFPLLQKNRKQVSSHPATAAYLRSRK